MVASLRPKTETGGTRKTPAAMVALIIVLAVVIVAVTMEVVLVLAFLAINVMVVDAGPDTIL